MSSESDDDKQECSAARCTETEGVCKRQVGTNLQVLCADCADIKRGMRTQERGSVPAGLRGDDDE